MTDTDLTDLLLHRWGLRISREMAKYLLRQIESATSARSTEPIPVIAGNARTGVAQRALLPTQELIEAASAFE